MIASNPVNINSISFHEIVLVKKGMNTTIQLNILSATQDKKVL